MKIRYMCLAIFALMLATMFAFGTKYVRQIYNGIVLREEIQSLLAGRTDMERFYISGDYTAPEAYIAHGGGIGDFFYTNSVEGVKDALEKGFKFIEIDFQKTADGRLVGVHDWKQWKEWAGIDDASNNALTYEQTKSGKVKGKYTVVDAEDLVRFMKENPDWILVTDKIQDFGLLVREIPFPDRMIVEVFSAEDYVRALKAGIRYPAFCVWNAKGVLEAKWYRFPIVTMDGYPFFHREEGVEQVQQLHDNHVTILMFDFRNYCDNPEFLRRYLGKTVSKFYTDHWAPGAIR